MPTYDYRCKACSHSWEEFQPITAQATKKCPECKKAKAERVIGAGAGLLFKGSGFYITDYRSDKYKSDAKADSGKSESKSEKKAESKSSDSKSSDSKSASKSND